MILRFESAISVRNSRWSDIANLEPAEPASSTAVQEYLHIESGGHLTYASEKRYIRRFRQATSADSHVIDSHTHRR